MQLAPQPFFFEHSTKGVILLHAFASGPMDVRMLARGLEKNDYTVYGPMFTGHGTPDFTNILTNGSPQQWWRDTKAAIQFLRDKGISQICIFGVSLGGIYAAKALEEDPNLLGGGSFGSPITISRDFSVHDTFMQMAKANYQRYHTPQEQMQAKLKYLDSNVDNLLDQEARFASEVARNLSKVHQPYFIGQGLSDQIVNPDVVQFIQSNLKNSSHVDVHRYENASHMITVNNVHKLLESDLNNFLEKLYK